MAVSGVGRTGKRVPHGERVRKVIGIWSSLVPRDAIAPKSICFERHSMKVPLRAPAHARSGDKGDTSNVAVIAYDTDLFPMIRDQLTAAVQGALSGVVRGEVDRFEVARLGVPERRGPRRARRRVSRSLCLDNYGKTLAARILDVPIEVPEPLAYRLRGPLPHRAADAF